MKSTGAGEPAALSPDGQSSACTARSTAPTLLACSAAQFNAALLDGDSSSPTTISFLIPHLHRVGPASLTPSTMGARTYANNRRWSYVSEDLRPPHPCRAFAKERRDIFKALKDCPRGPSRLLGSSMLPNHPVG